MLKIYENIKTLRIAKGWTQTQLAEKTGYANKGMIAKIENGKVDLPLKKITTFAQVFGVTEMQLMGWDDEPDINMLVTSEEYEIIEAYRNSPHKSAIKSLLGLN